jgi:hypothetical protein
MNSEIPSKNTTDWTVKETIGIGVVNSYPFWPWWKKMFNRLSFKSIKKRRTWKKLMKNIRKSEKTIEAFQDKNTKKEC